MAQFTTINQTIVVCFGRPGKLIETFCKRTAPIMPRYSCVIHWSTFPSTESVEPLFAEPQYDGPHSILPILVLTFITVF